MAKKPNKRIQALKDLVGAEKADEVRDTARQAQETLDNAGVERKDYKLRAFTTDELSALAEIASQKVAALMSEAGMMENMVGTMGMADETAILDMFSNAIEEAFTDATEPAEEPTSETPPEEEPDEEMAEAAEGTKPDDEEDEEDKAEGDDDEEKELADLPGALRALTDYLVVQTKEVGGIAEVQGEILTEFKALADFLPDLKARVEKLEQLVASRPRQASRSVDTAFDNPDSEIEAKKSIEEMRTSWLGLPVKEGSTNGK